MNGVPFAGAHPDEVTLGAYHDHELRGYALAAVEEHLEGCPRCRQAMSELMRLDGALRQLPEVEPPSVRDAVLTNARGRGRRPRHPATRLRWRLAAAIAAIVALLGGFGALASQQTALIPSASSSRHAPSPAVQPQSPGHAALPQAARRAAPSLGSASKDFAPNGSAHAPAASRVPRALAPMSADSPSSAGTQTQGQSPAPASATDARLIVRTGTMDLRVPDVQRTFNQVERIVANAKGYVANSDNNASTAGQGSHAATLTVRVPAANFGATTDRIAALPHSALSERSSSSDVTDSYHDLQAQAQALRTTRDQLMALMRKAHSTADAMSVLTRLTGVNTDIDRVQGQILSEANSVALSTITVNLSPQPKHHVVAPVRHHNEQTGWQPGRDLANALHNLGVALQAVVTFAIYAAVYLTLPALLLAVAWLVWRQRRREDRWMQTSWPLRGQGGWNE